MATRSRKGCIDCRHAKVKCDEIHPFCGTCARRGRQCKGYDFSNLIPKRRRESTTSRPTAERRPSAAAVPDQAMITTTNVSPIHGSNSAWSSVNDSTSFGDQYGEQSHVPAPAHASHTADSLTVSINSNDAEALATIITQAASKTMTLLREPSLIPIDDIGAADKTFIEVYFMRHPPDLVISDEFVAEMNAAVITLLQESPRAVSETLSAIGENYITGSTGSDVVQLSSRKARLLNRVRRVNEDGSSVELILGTILGLCGVELIQHQTDGRGTPLLKLLENIALMLEFHLPPGKELSSTARYFARALARQDMLISLSRMKRPQIQPRIWLDDHAATKIDRLWGYTATLAPMLTDLCALAEDVQAIMDAYAQTDGLEAYVESDDIVARSAGLAEREGSIRMRLLAWRPTHDFSVTMQTARKVLLHAYAWRAAALLYLYRLFNRPGTSFKADQTALGMAYDVMLHISGPGDNIKLSLWPLFLAGCEMERQEDRDNANELFDRICRARPTVTGRRTQWFCVSVVWPARDCGRDWDWMQLSRTEFNDFIPI